MKTKLKCFVIASVAFASMVGNSHASNFKVDFPACFSIDNTKELYTLTSSPYSTFANMDLIKSYFNGPCIYVSKDADITVLEQQGHFLKIRINEIDTVNVFWTFDNTVY